MVQFLKVWDAFVHVFWEANTTELTWNVVHGKLITGVVGNKNLLGVLEGFITNIKINQSTYQLDWTSSVHYLLGTRKVFELSYL